MGGEGEDRTTTPDAFLRRLEDGPNDTTKWWSAGPEHKGRVGFITSMSSNFCSSCNSLRITADGKIKACLFGGSEADLRGALRRPPRPRRGGEEVDDEEELRAIVNVAVKGKKFSLGGHGSAEGIRKANDNRPMTLIGG